MYPEGLEVYILGWFFIFIYTLCMRAAKALASLHIRAVSPEPSLVDYNYQILIYS